MFHWSTKGSNEVGGLIGYLNTSTYEDLTFIGTVLTNGTSGTNYVGGLIGNVNSGERTFINCAVSGTAHGGNNASGAGLFCNPKNAITATFQDCKVGIGSHRKASSGGTGDLDFKFDAQTELTKDLVIAAFTATKATDVTITDEAGNLTISIVDPSTL